MGRTRQTTEQLGAILREAEATLGRSPALADLVRRLEIADSRWRQQLERANTGSSAAPQLTSSR